MLASHTDLEQFTLADFEAGAAARTYETLAAVFDAALERWIAYVSRCAWAENPRFLPNLVFLRS